MGRFCVAVLVLVWLIAVPAAAQETTGGVTGAVTSTDTLPLPAVTILIEDAETGLRRSASSNRHGAFHVTALPPGAYTMIATMEGFRTSRSTVVVPLGITARHDIQLEVGAFSDTLEVRGDAPPINTASAAPCSATDSSSSSSCAISTRTPPTSTGTPPSGGFRAGRRGRTATRSRALTGASSWS